MASEIGARERTNFARDVVEAALAHAIKDTTEAAYRHRRHLPKRTKLMEAWAGYCASTPVADGANVTPIGRRG